MNFNLWQYLTDNYKKMGGNIEKIFIILGEQLIQINEAIKALLEMNSLDKSTGSNLDRIGEEEGLSRNGRLDQDYRSALRFEISRKSAAEDINSINAALSFYLQESFDSVEEGNAEITIVVNRFLSEGEKDKIKRLSAAGIGTSFRTEQKLEKAGLKIVILCLTGEEVTI